MILAGVLLLLRAWQARTDLRTQSALFPKPTKGLFKLWVREEPQVLFEHAPGGHETGRTRGVYDPQVREVRAVCQLVSLNGRPLPPVKVRAAFFPAPGRSQAVLSYGDEVEVEGKVQAPAPPLNPGQFDYPKYLRDQGLLYVLYGAPGKWQRTPAPPRGWFLPRWAASLKRWSLDTLDADLEFPENALLAGILLGERSPLPEDLVRSFFLTGTIHILAVSGMMTAFLAGLCFLVLRALRVPRKWAAGVTLPLLLLFTLVTGAHPPVCRAAVFSGLALLALLLERKVHGGTLLLGTAFFLLLLNPLLLEDLSFQISFLATAGLMVMASPLLEKLSFLWRPAALLVTATLSAQFAVWVLMADAFNQVSLYSVPANLVVVPLALFSAAGGAAVLAGSLIHPALGHFLGGACEMPLKFLLGAADRMAALPGVEWVVASPPGGWVLLYHLFLLAGFYFYWPRPRPVEPSPRWKEGMKKLRRGRRWFMRAAAVFLCAAVAVFLGGRLERQPLRVTYLAVGHGNAVVVRSPQGRVLVLDGGKENKGADRFSPLVTYLRHEGLDRVDGALLTHPDEDHVGGLYNLLGACRVGEVFESGRNPAPSFIYRRFEGRIKELGIPKREVEAGDPLEGLEPMDLELLHPPREFHPHLHAVNNLSLATLLTFRGVRFLFPGDLEKEGLLRLFNGNPGLAGLDWLMAPHHGRRSGEPGLCAKDLTPRFTVLSDWRDYADDHVLFGRARPGARVFSTALDGAIEVEVGEGGKGRWRTFEEGKWHSF
ncbi:MAG TPA: ComEC/Rec2 family competence protein [bacterium]|nr:ComEC/Rec2 family competence protein [bacterium]